MPSPLDFDFFDLLQRLEPNEKDEPAVKSILEWSMQPKNILLRSSMEKMFYTLHLRAYLREKLYGSDSRHASSRRVVTNFALAIQSLLRKAHGTKICSHHQHLLSHLRGNDIVISFNYDLVIERALRPIAEKRRIRFGPNVYGFGQAKPDTNLPLLLKLHGSSNWRIGEESKFSVATDSWARFDEVPGYRRWGQKPTTDFPIFLPFWEKRVEKGRWAELWKLAAQRLQRTNNLVVWGYSLPETDVKSRELFRIAVGDRQIRLCVIDPSPSSRSRWRDVLLDAKFWEYERVSDFLDHPPSWWRAESGRRS